MRFQANRNLFFVLGALLTVSSARSIRIPRDEASLPTLAGEARSNDWELVGESSPSRKIKARDSQHDLPVVGAGSPAANGSQPHDLQNRQKCGPKTCTSMLCDRPKISPGLLPSPPQARNKPASSLDARAEATSTQPAQPTDTTVADAANSKSIISSPYGELTSTASFYGLAMYPHGLNLTTTDLTGCTAMYVVSHNAVYAAHYWETLAFEDEHPHKGGKHNHTHHNSTSSHALSPKKTEGHDKFKSQVLNPIIAGQLYKGQEVQASLAKNSDAFQKDGGYSLYIITPQTEQAQGKDGLTSDVLAPLYPAQISLLQKAVETILGSAPVEAKVQLYDPVPSKEAGGEGEQAVLEFVTKTVSKPESRGGMGVGRDSVRVVLGDEVVGSESW